MKFENFKNLQQVFNHAAKFFLYTDSSKICKTRLGDEFGNVCVLGSMLTRDKSWLKKPDGMKKQFTYKVIEINKLNRICGNVLLKFVLINDSVKPSRRPQRLRSLAKRYNLTIPIFLEKKVLGY